jgi:phosphoglycolate phosphatase-like HAD superfamily hydrolase
MKRTEDCYIFDIDGTLADLSHRLHFIKDGKKDWNSFKHFCFADKPIWHMINLARRLYWAARAESHSQHYDGPDYRIVLMSGRNESQRDDTVKWLYDVACLSFDKLYMRADLDYRSDDIIKAELLQELRIDGYVPIMAFDDRDRVVKMWRTHGVPCAQVAEGDF